MGAFLIPWWNRAAFARALAIPLALLASLSLSWHFFGKQLPTALHWTLYVFYWALFVPFAVTCHRLVLLEPRAVASRMAPRWSRRETGFFLWLAAVGVTFAGVVFVLTTSILNAPFRWKGEPGGAWFQWSVFLAKLPAFYLCARLSVVFPAIAVDRKVSLKWAWDATTGNGWRLVLVVGALPWVISGAVGLLYRLIPGVATTVALTVAGFALLVVEVAAISLSYRELVQDELRKE